MPAKTPDMQRFMALCAHNPSKAQGKCPPHKVAEEFSHKPEGGYHRVTGAARGSQLNASGHHTGHTGHRR